MRRERDGGFHAIVAKALKHDGEITTDALFGGALALHQPARKRGYRVNVDALLLASFASARRVRHAIDLGAGVGAIGLSLLHLGAAARVTLIEIDPRCAELATLNAEANGWSDRVDVVTADVRNAAEAHRATADLVVCNPPYVPPGRGRVPLVGRGARVGELDTFLDAARIVAGRRARIAFVYPALEATSLLCALRKRGMEPKRLRAVHGRGHDPARVVLIEAALAKPGGLAIEPPFVEMTGTRRSDELESLLTSPRR